jgi:hypothetical protein
MKTATMTVKNLKSFEAYAKRLTIAEIARCHEKAVKMNQFYNYAVARVELAEYIEMIESAHFLNSVRSFTNKERNALRRDVNSNKRMSTFCKSLKVESQAFRIDEALTDFHSMHELLALDQLQDCKESRIKSHISFLQHEFKHCCKLQIEDDTKRVKRFRFVTI